MNHAKLLDCTLRDGAYLIEKNFGEANIKGIIKGLMNARIDYIEIGFLQDEGGGVGKTVYLNSQDAKKYIPSKKNGCQFAVLADYSRYSIDNLDYCTGDSIDIVRECFFKKERFAVIDACREIKKKGYKLFVQPVDILGYTDIELIEFIELINDIEPYCLSIVDTFGSMYQEDLHRVFEIVHHNLISTCKIGFHSHNNMQLSNALSQEFLRMAVGKRECVIDGTIAGMGRGAGNTPTELIAQYMVSRMNYSYDIDAILDVIDGYMENIKARCSWGYSTPCFIAGAYGAHVNNVQYLTKKNSIQSKDIRYILNKIGNEKRKRYDYDYLEQTYMDYMMSNVDDTKAMLRLGNILNNNNVVVLIPGKTLNIYKKIIEKYINDNNSIVIGINFISEEIQMDFVYFSNLKRYKYWENRKAFRKVKKIITSNIKQECEENDIISFNRLIKCGWEHMDNSAIMLFRLLDYYNLKTLAIAGFDGYSCDLGNRQNYVLPDMELSAEREEPVKLNQEIMEMMEDFYRTRKNNYDIKFITPSRFEKNY